MNDTDGKVTSREVEAALRRTHDILASIEWPTDWVPNFHNQIYAGEEALITRRYHDSGTASKGRFVVVREDDGFIVVKSDDRQTEAGTRFTAADLSETMVEIIRPTARGRFYRRARNLLSQIGNMISAVGLAPS